MANKKVPTPKPFNSGTMTTSQFFGMIRSALRKASIYWKPITQVKNESRVPYKGDNKKRKYSYICNKCKKEYSSLEVNVHHIIDCGSLKSFEDLPQFVKNLFVEKEGLIVLCKKCHSKEHNK
jgi:capsule polysaccharide export protein KpsC/LpsZ